MGNGRRNRLLKVVDSELVVLAARNSWNHTAAPSECSEHRSDGRLSMKHELIESRILATFEGTSTSSIQRFLN
jgi:hypothetical protein